MIARTLEGSWRADPPPLDVPPRTLEEIAPLILETGAGGLAWWRVRDTELGESPVGADFQQAFRAQTLQSGLHGRALEEAVGKLCSAGVEPLLAKGWLAASLYAQRGLRPYGDIDLWVRPEQHGTALEALGYPSGQQYPVDLHGNSPARDRSWDEVYARGRPEEVGGVSVQALGAEDHLYLLSVHMLAHGAWRPLWLCDVAAALESLPEDFDWDYCLSGGPRRANWLASAIGLATRLLGASAEGLPAEVARASLPRWLAPSVLRSWSSADHYMHSTPVGLTLRRPRALLGALRLRWPNPIQVTIDWDRRFDGTSRLPVQLAECVVRSGRFLLGRPTATPPV